ncbi:MAG: exo-alpha-sialidase [Psychromonas sp.]|nr:exo-alpha-sialidase [Psychromonas sp.]
MTQYTNTYQQKNLIKISLFTSFFALLMAFASQVSGAELTPTTSTHQVALPSAKKTEVTTVKNTQVKPTTKINWDKNTVKFITAGAYSRIIKLADDQLGLVYNNGTKINYRISSDNGDTWSKEVTLADGGSKYTYTNAAFIKLYDGTLLYGYNARPNKDGGADNYQIRVLISHDNGKTWPVEKVVYSGGNVGTLGVWEPAFLQLPSGELQLYFANESLYPKSNDQQITLIRSFDQGNTWTAGEAVSYRAESRDGMPVPILLNDKSSIVFSIEDNGFDGKFKPTTIRTSLSDNWSSGFVDGASKKRDRALTKNSQLPSKNYGGAPFLVQLPEGETLLSIQSSQWRNHGMATSVMRVYIGDSQAKNFSSMSTPFTSDLIKPNGSALWNSLTVLNKSTVIATSTITPGNSKPTGIYTVKGTVIRN